MVESFEEKLANPAALLMLLPSAKPGGCLALKGVDDHPSLLSFLYDTEEISANLRKLADSARSAAQSFSEATAAIAEVHTQAVARLADFSAALASVSA